MHLPSLQPVCGERPSLRGTSYGWERACRSHCLTTRSVLSLKDQYIRLSEATTERPSLEEIEVFRELRAEYYKAVTSVKGGGSMVDTELDVGRGAMHILSAKPGFDLGPTGASGHVSDSDDDDLMAHPGAMSAAEMVQVKGLADKQKGFFDAMPLPSASGTNDMSLTFRRRRLTFATQGNIPPHTPLHLIQNRVFRSLEIGDVPKIPMPFPDTVVGTYSCHGIEPSYMDSKPFVAKINQDRGAVVFPFAGKDNTAVFAVFDGHGEVGDKVSEFCMFEVPKMLEAHPYLETDPIKAFKDTFVKVDEALGRQPKIEAFYSGTTAVVGMVRGSRIYVANSGDSRCTMGTMKDGKIVAQDLSIDQNPDSPAEMDRILRAGGYVSPPPEPGLSARVWLDSDFTQVGLAMARSLGDHAVKGVGVIAEPEVLIHDFTEDDQFILFASDGVWEFITSQEAVDIVSENLPKGPAYACQVLIENAASRWHDMEGDYRDDITALVVRVPPFGA